jgi:quinol monooxygenase YgiN
METIQIVAELEIKQAYRDELFPVLQALVEGSRSEPGNKRYDLTENIDRPGHFFVIEDWISESAVESHNASLHFQAFAHALKGKSEKLCIVKVRKLFE